MLSKGLKGALLSLALLLLSACNESSPPPQTAGGKMPPMPVTVAKVLYETISEWDEYTGRLEAPQTVELRPRVSGYIDKVLFTEGSIVKQGDLLFLIDPRQYQAEVNRLNAELKSAEARLKLANSDLNRAQSLRKQSAIAIEQVEARSADLDQAQANVESIKAALDVAKLNLSFTRVTAPISGRVSRAQVTAGNYVSDGETELTSLVSMDKVYAYFDVDEQAYLRFHNQSGQANRSVQMQLANEQGYPHVGKLDFVDNQVNPQTGTIRVRAVFENQNNQFTPGLFARLRLVSSDRYQAILINDRAVGTDLNNKFVLVLGEGNTLEYRAIKLGPKVSGLRVVRSGLNPDDKIVIKGLQRVFPGSQVQPEDAPMAEPEVLDALRADNHLANSPVAGKATTEATES
ncbi:efflux transporter periplasmic adaptor subunit [Hahella sp. CCB-MM4]|uniref:efflux RND transporter periplasmic adaptor subunit n=1 Tax=Hahella sp. (strain CCB-MM4) TaxID=1926491 RepID=UPI000BC417A0|nr:efflux RND transporter periplasmic adaptor subunit [Hahella sp. CCB-MM4]OZG73189.1 efflux transporter periplasmic adaptor subunit [Hahella sp. CCB-MM4]